jgi:alpha-tubulin suppressor-like RCC1 family protein
MMVNMPRLMAQVLTALTTVVVLLAVTAPGGASAAMARGRGHQQRPAGAPSGTLLAWGGNNHGQLGDGKRRASNVPVAVALPAGTSVTDAAAGESHTLALTATGAVLAWGDNKAGELGDGGTVPSTTPVSVTLPAGVKVTSVQAGCRDSVALTSAGSVLDWGKNDYGELGVGNREDSDVPVSVKLPAGVKVTAVAASCFFDLALTSAGQLLAWGRDYEGSLGNGKQSASSPLPIRVRLPRGVTITSMAVGGYSALAVTASGRVYAWGGGSATPQLVKLPAQSAVGKPVMAAAGALHDLVLTSRGVILAWGYNVFGQVGNGSTCNCDVGLVEVSLPAGTRVTAITAGFYDSYALNTDGGLLAWGWNSPGSLGAGLTVDGSGTPVPVALPAGQSAVAILGGTTADSAFAIVTPAPSAASRPGRSH